MRILEKLEIENFKSIRQQCLELGALNVFIGGNGSGKSNLIEVFRLLREIVNRNLRGYTLKKGGADSLLHYGRRHFPELRVFAEFAEGDTSNAYEVLLAGTDENALVIGRETAFYRDRRNFERPYDKVVASYEEESKLRDTDHVCARQVVRDLESYRVYHFHDTSDTAPARGASEVEDNRFLRPQAENLPAFLYLLQERHPQHFANIVGVVRQVAPFFDTFQLAPSRLNPEKIRLEWREKGTDTYFSASSFSDGTLRFICLATLLLQPDLPAVVLLDEPELGLHPAAVTILAGLLSSAATRTQVIVATQSVTLVNQFGPEQVWTVDRCEGASYFRHLAKEDMSAWLENYALGELWEKNILGGRP